MLMRCLFVFFTLLAAGPPGVLAGDWPQFLGPERDGLAPADAPKLPGVFPNGEPKVLWKKPVGHGLAGPVVAGGKVILFHRVGGEALVEAFLVKDGAPVWKSGAPTSYRDQFGFDDGPRSAPTVSGGRVFAYGADGVLRAVDLDSGKALWSHDLAKELESPPGWFGRCCAPLVAGKNVIVNCGGKRDGKDAGIAAFDAETGAIAWTTSDDEAGYSSPRLARVNDREVAVFFTRRHVQIVDPAAGSVLGSELFEPDIDASASGCTPVLCGPGRFFLSACYGVGGALWQVQPDFSLKAVWREQDRLDCHYGTPVFVDGHLYGFHGRQEQGQTLRCIEAATGKVKWTSDRLPAGTVLASGSQLVALTEKGELILQPASPDAFKPTARDQILTATTRAFPALADGVLYARDGKNLVAVELK